MQVNNGDISPSFLLAHGQSVQILRLRRLHTRHRLCYRDFAEASCQLAMENCSAGISVVVVAIGCSSEHDGHSCSLGLLNNEPQNHEGDVEPPQRWNDAPEWRQDRINDG